MSGMRFYVVTIIPKDEADLLSFEVIDRSFPYTLISPSPNIGIPHSMLINGQDLKILENQFSGSNFTSPRQMFVKPYNNELLTDQNDYGRFANVESFFETSPSDMFKQHVLKLNANLNHLGLSYENQPIYMGSIYPRRENIAALEILLVGGLHSQSPIIPNFFKFLMSSLVNHADQNLRKMVKWHFIPIINPDGFEYANVEDPLWVKNLSPNYDGCFGTHLLKNFKSSELNEHCESCSLDYPGANGFSEVETQYLRSFVLSIRRNLKLYFNIAYIGSFLTWTSENITNNKNIRKILDGSTDFPCRVAADVAKSAFQNDLDWMTEIGIPYTFSLAVNTSDDFRKASNLIFKLAEVVKLRHILSECVWTFKKERVNSACNFI